MFRGSASTFSPRLMPSWGSDREVWGKREREGGGAGRREGEEYRGWEEESGGERYGDGG